MYVTTRLEKNIGKVSNNNRRKVGKRIEKNGKTCLQNMVMIKGRN